MCHITWLDAENEQKLRGYKKAIHCDAGVPLSIASHLFIFSFIFHLTIYVFVYVYLYCTCLSILYSSYLILMIAFCNTQCTIMFIKKQIFIHRQKSYAIDIIMCLGSCSSTSQCLINKSPFYCVYIECMCVCVLITHDTWALKGGKMCDAIGMLFGVFWLLSFSLFVCVCAPRVCTIKYINDHSWVDNWESRCFSTSLNKSGSYSSSTSFS